MITSRGLFDYRSAVGVIAIAVGLWIGITAHDNHLAFVPILVVAGVLPILRAWTRRMTFGPQSVELKRPFHRAVVWNLHDGLRLTYEHRKIGSRWGLAQPDFLVLRDRHGSSSVAIVDGLMSRQREWAAYLRARIADGSIQADSQAAAAVERLAHERS